MLPPGSVFWRISGGWSQWTRQAARHVAEIMDVLAERGVVSVTRVMPDPHKDIGLNILSQFHYGPEIQIATFQTLADALQSMAGSVDSPST